MAAEAARRIATALAARGETLATVECSLGGALGGALTAVPGASGWFLGGVAPYSAAAKERLLGVGGPGLGAEGAVSPMAARVLARAFRERLGADWVLAETGVAGPRGQHRSTKEPGTAFLALYGPDGIAHEMTVSTGLEDREQNRRAFLDAALSLISTTIKMPVV